MAAKLLVIPTTTVNLPPALNQPPNKTRIKLNAPKRSNNARTVNLSAETLTTTANFPTVQVTKLLTKQAQPMYRSNHD